MPANVYVSMTPSLTVNSVSRVVQQDFFTQTIYDRMNGFGLVAALGKEWWVSAHWGLGVAGEGFFSWNREGSDSARTWGGRVAFSGTFN